jgi:hypothetical protein
MAVGEQEHGKKKSLSEEMPGGRCCFSFPMRMMGLRPCISMGRQNSSKEDCYLLFLNCPSKASFKRSKGFSESLQTANRSRMSRRTCLGRMARALAYIFQFLRSDACRCEMGLNEAEPNVRFLLSVGAKLDLSFCCRSDRVGQIVL